MPEMLAEFAVTRDPELRNALAVRHLPLVKFVARRMSANLPGNVEIDDLVSWGSIGLLDAIDKFDPGRKVQFSTYAVTRIRGSILDGLQHMDWAPKQITSKVRALRRLRETMTNELGYEPSVAELAQRMEVAEADVRGWLLDDATTRIKPLAPVREDGESESEGRWLLEEAEQTISAEVAEIRARVVAAISALPEREQEVLRLYYRDSLTLRQIAAELGVSVSSATQTHTRLVERVRARLATFGDIA